MIKLTQILKEEQFAARAKDSGKIVYFKSKEGRDQAVKAGTHTDPEKEAKPQAQTQPQKPAGADLFGKDYQAQRGGGETPKSQPTEFKPDVDSVVYNTRTNTIGIVRLADERGETKTDADGNVNTDELEPYNPMKYPHQKDAQVAPSTKKEIETRNLWKPFSQSNQKPTKLKDLMPGADFSKKTLDQIDPMDKQRISMTIDKLAKMGEEAKAKGEKAPNYNLCQVTIPGTNLYCDDNKGIPRADMPQFKGVPEKGSPADKLPKDNNGEADTEEFFKQMLNKEGINVSEPVSVKPDRLKATQSELVGVKVAGMSKVLEDKTHPAYGKITAPIYVSNDGYVLDGHHRWAAVVAHNAAHPDDQIPMNVRVIDEPIVPLVKRSNDFAEKIGIRPKAADTDEKKPNAKEFYKKVSDLTDRNEHSQAAVELAKFMGDDDAVDTLQKIKKRHDKRGYLSDSDANERRSVVKYLMSVAKEKLSKQDYKYISNSF